MDDNLFSKIKAHWNPKPIQPPVVDPDLPKLTGLQRATESLRYSILSVEWWLCPNGKLREWLRINGKLGSVLLVPAVLVVPLITFILWQMSKWVGWLVSIAGNLILFPLAAFGAVVVTAGVAILIRTLFGK